ncbi:peptidase domain-containing ABC transporter [Chitinophaga silvatica]|uniref:Peptidase domain-containing ABC transporter n=1 Tax=Chitinophaga silvatica TaxID=2282649 RepID=A0A3E1YI92_9BACT|nr:peptidase domain-containing ABC transporter [Chitinophaga silvatica]
MPKKFPFFRQLDQMDCGPTCLQMISTFYGRNYSLQSLREKSFITREGVSLLGISEAAESIGFRTLSATLPFENLKEEAPLPFIAHWKQNHFVVVYKLDRNYVHIADPNHGLVKLSHDEFKKNWISTKNKGEDTGVALFLEATPSFFEEEGEKNEKRGLLYFYSYLKPYKKFFLQLYVGMLISTILALVFPFLSQSIIDIGINNKNLSFINLILISQLLLYTATVVVDFIRGWIFLHMGTRISISIISDFLIKLLKLPFSFFDNKTIGDLLQRIGDHSRIQSFLASSALNILFSIIDFVIFGILLIFYSIKIFFIFLIGNTLYILWTAIFLKKRKALDYKHFNQAASNQSVLLQLLNGVQEIKLQNCEKKKRWEWERVQARQFKISVESLALGQYQQTGAFFIDRIKNILISYMAAKAVIDGNMTLGMMLSISYIVGQLNGPISQLIGLIYSFQDAKISLERLSEIHDKKDEIEADVELVTELPFNKTLILENVTFSYGGPHSPKVLENISLKIPEGKKTAIVGLSGSGKTTLLKLLLKVYEPTEGELRIGETNLKNIHHSFWRDKCGIVSQDGYLFSDTIANNIAISDDIVDKKKLLKAVKVANIKEFIDKLPLTFNTKIGQDGSGISQGQKQRLLIARAVYKNPDYVFLDEATNSLDAHNEREIVGNLEEFLSGKTVVIVAHRLSTVKNADQIVVMREGRIVECGTHNELIANEGEYYKLVKEQLNL